MNRERASRAYDLIAEGFAELAFAVRESEQPAAGVGVPPSSDPAPADLTNYETPAATYVSPPLKPQVDAGLGVCPTHGVHWIVKSGGISKNGKPYKSFWKCAEKDGDTFCNEKPQRIWADTHPIREVAA